MNLCLNRQINISWFNGTRCYIESHHYVSLTNGLRYPFINVCVHVTLNRKGSQSRLDLRSTDLQILTTDTTAVSLQVVLKHKFLQNNGCNDDYKLNDSRESRLVISFR